MGRSCNRYPDEIREKILYLKREGKTNREIGDAVGLSKDQIAWFLNNYYRALHKKDPEKYPKRKAGSQPKPKPTKRELMKIIRQQEKLLKLYQDFLQLSGRI